MGTDWLEPYLARSAQYWDDIEAFFNNLQDRLFLQGRLLRNNLAIHYSGTGDVRDILARPGDYPHITLPCWLVDDFAIPPGDARRNLERHLVPATLYIFATIYTHELILDEDSGFDNTVIYLAQALAHRADWYFLQLFNAGSPFWEYHRQFWREQAHAALLDAGQIPAGALPVSHEDVLQSRDTLAPYKMIPTAIALHAGREGDLSRLHAAMDHLHMAVKILQDLSTMGEDLRRGKYTYPVLATMAEMGLSAVKGFSADGLFAVMSMSGSLQKMLQECHQHLEACRHDAIALGLFRLSLYTDLVTDRLLQFEDMAVKKNPVQDKDPSQSVPHKAAARTTQDSLGLVLQMARGYLLSDLSFRESWEVHRRGLAGAPEVTARFPAGLILEILCWHGLDVQTQVDKFIQDAADTNFSYYDHPDLPYADTDTLGLLLRLAPYASDPDALAGALAVPLEWMAASVTASGRIPVWINSSPLPGQSTSQDVRLIGERCGTIEANLLVGLCEYGWDEYRTLIENACQQLLERFIQHGAGITVNYPRLYCLWTINRLLKALSGKRLPSDLENLLEQAAATYDEHFSYEETQYRITPQEAALLILACLNSPAEERFSNRWVSILMKSQRPDGSWYGEPMFFVPNRGEVTAWHSSHVLTSAHCFHALKLFGASPYND